MNRGVAMYSDSSCLQDREREVGKKDKQVCFTLAFLNISQNSFTAEQFCSAVSPQFWEKETAITSATN